MSYTCIYTYIFVTICVLFLLFLKSEYNCFTLLCCFLLPNEVSQVYVDIYPLPLEPPSHPYSPPHQVITEHRAELPAPHRCFLPAICFTHGGEYKLMLLSQFVPRSPYPTCPCFHSQCLHLYSCLANSFICTIFLDSTYMD